MRRTIILNYKGISVLKSIRSTIQRNDGSARVICPSWCSFKVEERDSSCNDSCDICKELFLRVTHTSCPCHKYTPHYLIRRLTEIIDYNEKNVEN